MISSYSWLHSTGFSARKRSKYFTVLQDELLPLLKMLTATSSRCTGLEAILLEILLELVSQHLL